MEADPQALCKQSPTKSSQKVPPLSPSGGTWELEAELSTAEQELFPNAHIMASQWLPLGNFLVVWRN